jgi:hypothetical protein
MIQISGTYLKIIIEGISEGTVNEEVLAYFRQQGEVYSVRIHMLLHAIFENFSSSVVSIFIYYY